MTNSCYPLVDQDYHVLAGIQAVTFVTERPDIDAKPASLRPFMSRFYPSHLLETVGVKKSIGKLFRQKSVDQPSVEDLFREQYDSVRAKCTAPHNLKVLYLQYCWSKPYYG